MQPKEGFIKVILGCLVVAAALQRAEAQADILPVVGSEHRHPRACRNEDARCLALQRDVCDPWNVTTTDKCTFVQVDEHCREDVNRINYLALFYCHNKVAMVFAGLGWMLGLFFVMTITAEIFLCPAIEYLAARMGMAPDIAGVTLFAFASGAPDLFTQVAALAAGDHVDIELAVSATFGGGLFIICIVFAAVILAAGGDLAIPERRAFSRDTSAYMVATLGTIALLWVGKLTALDGIFLVSGYFVYLAICLGTRSKSPPGGAFQPLGMNSSQAGGGGHAERYSSSASQHGNGDFAVEIDGLNDAELELVPFSLEVVNDPGSPAQQAQHTPPSQRYPASPMTSKRSGPSFEPKHGGPVTKADLNLRPRSPAGSRHGISNGSTTLGGSGNAHNGHSEIYEESEIAPVLPIGAPPPSRTPYGVWGPGGARGALADWWRDLPETLDETLHLHGKSGFRRWFAYATAPLVLCMHATMPAVNAGTFSMAYAGAFSIVGPPFFLVFASAGPARLGLGGFITAWLSSSLVLLTLAFAVHPLDTPAHLMQGLIVPSSPNEGKIASAAAAAAAAAQQSPFSLQPASSRGSGVGLLHGHRPRRCLLFAVLGFMQSILWLNATAEEVVSIFEAIGRIWNVRRDTLGATVLAWGETVPDLVAVVSLSKAGQGTMAIAACFGGPVFNLLVSMGGPILIAGARTGSIDYQMTSGVLVLVISTITVLVGLLLIVPLRYGWRLPRQLGWSLVGVYAVSQVIFLMAEGIVLW